MSTYNSRCGWKLIGCTGLLHSQLAEKRSSGLARRLLLAIVLPTRDNSRSSASICVTFYLNIGKVGMLLVCITQYWYPSKLLFNACTASMRCTKTKHDIRPTYQNGPCQSARAYNKTLCMSQRNQICLTLYSCTIMGVSWTFMFEFNDDIFFHDSQCL